MHIFAGVNNTTYKSYTAMKKNAMRLFAAAALLCAALPAAAQLRANAGFGVLDDVTFDNQHVNEYNHDLKPFNACFTLGFAVDYKRWRLQFSEDVGMVHIYSHGNTYMHSNTYSLGVGYILQ